jgi:carbon monoxide dehydrogenase subunit G
MELEHSFTIPVPPEQAWEVLLDVEQVAPCMPGATIDAVDGEVISGKIKVKVGPIALTYSGKARFTEKDEQARVVVLEASGKETRGSGTASATVRSTLEDLGQQTRVTVHTTMNITGRPAQFGRGVMVEVGGKIIEKFAANLAAQLASGGPAAQPAPAGTAAQLATGSTAAQLAPESTAAQPAPASQPAGVPAGSAQQSESQAAAAAARQADLASADEYTGDVTLLPIEELNLPNRSYNSLRREGVHTVGALASRNEKDLLAIDGLGPQSIKEIKQKLADHGLTLDDAAARPAAAPTTSPAATSPAATSPAATSGAATSGTGSTVGRAARDTAGQRKTAGQAARDTAASSASGGGPAQSANGSAPSPAARPADEDSLNLLAVAGLPLLKRALPGIGALAGLVLLFALRSRRKRRRARAASV